MHVSIHRNRTRLGIGNVEFKERSAGTPLLEFFGLRDPLQNAPYVGHRVMRIAHHIGGNVTKRTTFALHAPNEMIDSSLVDGKPVFHSLVDHPEQWKFGESTLLLGIPPTNIRMYSCKPDLLNVLRF